MQRRDLTSLKIWVIDPPFCTDRDDGFALTQENDSMIVWLFVADPTEEFQYDSHFEDVTRLATTKYFIDKTPDHLFPEDVVNKYSLGVGIKPVVCVKVVFDGEHQIKSNEVFFATIQVTETLEYQNTTITDELALAIEISEKLFERRTGSGKVLRNHKIALPVQVNKKWKLHLDDTNTIKLKNMIAEFAILANQVVANKLNINFNRTCDTVDYTSDPQVFLENIIRDGVRSCYKVSDEKHMLIDDKVYTHFTSPLRRKSDCIVHFLLKGVDIPVNRLMASCEEINAIVRIDKKRQHNEVKKYTFLAMSQMQKPIRVKLRVVGKVGRFVNMIMYNVNELPVQVSITIVTTSFVPQEYETYIQTVNMNGIYDSDILIGLI